MLKIPEHALAKVIRRHLPHAVTIRDTAFPAVLDAAAFYAPHMPLTMSGTLIPGHRHSIVSGGKSIRYAASVTIPMKVEKRRTREEIEVFITEMGVWCLDNVGDDAVSDLLLSGNRREFSYEGQWATIHAPGKDVVFHFRSQTIATGFKIAFG